MKRFGFLDLLVVGLVLFCADLVSYSGTDAQIVSKSHGHAVVLFWVYVVNKMDLWLK